MVMIVDSLDNIEWSGINKFEETIKKIHDINILSTNVIDIDNERIGIIDLQNQREYIDDFEIYDIIRDIKDPYKCISLCKGIVVYPDILFMQIGRHAKGWNDKVY